MSEYSETTRLAQCVSEMCYFCKAPTAIDKREMDDLHFAMDRYGHIIQNVEHLTQYGHVHEISCLDIKVA